MDFTIIPYTHRDGVPTFADSEIRALYERSFQSGMGEMLFHDGSIPSADHWLSYVKGPGVLLYVIFYKGEIAGFCWLNRLEATSAYCHFAAFPEHWGTDVPVNGGKLAMQTFLTMQDQQGNYIFHTIMGMLPSTSTIQIDYCKRVGLKTVGEVPNLIWSAKEGKPVTGTVMYITREELDDEDLH